MANQTPPRKRGRKTNLERSLILAATLARTLGDEARDLQANCTLAEVEIDLIKKSLIATEATHEGLVRQCESGSKQLAEVEPMLIEAVAYARVLYKRRDHLINQVVTYRTEMVIVNLHLQNLKALYDYFLSCFEAKHGGVK